MSKSQFFEIINEHALHDAAVAHTGWDDFGDDGYKEGLRVLLDAARRSPRLEAIAERLRHIVLAALSSRLSSQAGWNANPHVLESPVRAPIVITGLPRSGTTLLHFLMSLDSQFQWTPRWVGEAPIIRPPREEWETHPQYKIVHDRLEAMFAANPGLRTAHEMGAGLADECITVMVQSFTNNTFVSTLPLPEYREWFFNADERPSYERYKKNLRLMGALSPDKTWLLKNPFHTFGMEGLLTSFSDAKIIVLHRNPLETIASGASLTYRNGDFWMKSEIGPIRLDVYTKAVERMSAARSRFSGNFIDIGYRELTSDTLGTVRQIYQYFGLDLSDDTAVLMQKWLDANPQGKHGKHTYSLEEFGLSDEIVKDRFSAYIRQYNL